MNFIYYCALFLPIKFPVQVLEHGRRQGNLNGRHAVALQAKDLGTVESHHVPLEKEPVFE